MPSVISGDANVSATEFGYLDGVTSALQTQMDSKLPIAGGKILQIVRATDSTLRTTTSTSAVDANLSVTITPTKNTSAIILLCNLRAYIENTTDNNKAVKFLITDSSNNTISGAEQMWLGAYNGSGVTTANTAIFHSVFLTAYATPATTSATTYKVRFMTDSPNTTLGLSNNGNTAQMYAIEVSA